MTLQQATPDTIVDTIFELFAQAGGREYLGEAVTQKQHMEQTAACAIADDADTPLICAALLHDIGHLIDDQAAVALEQDIDRQHEDLGADFLAPCFPPSVTEPIRLHVAAKRYLCAVDDQYFGHLSKASVHSLELQGGPMSAAEVAQFESNPHYQDAVRLRRYDDDGKVRGLRIDPVTEYRASLESLLQT